MEQLVVKKGEGTVEEEERRNRAQRSKVVVTFDLVGSKILFNQDEGLEFAPGSSGILHPPGEKELNRINPNPNLKLQPIFIDPGLAPMRRPDGRKASSNRTLGGSGMCLEITGRVRHDDNKSKHLITENRRSQWQVVMRSPPGYIPADVTECY